MASNTDDDFESGETTFPKRDSSVCDAVMAGDHGTMYGSVRAQDHGEHLEAHLITRYQVASHPSVGMLQV